MIKIFLISLASIIIGALINPKVGKKNNQKLISESTILSEPLLKSLTNRIAKSLNLAEIPVRVHEVKSFNGLATSEGQIFLTRGALDDFYNGKVTAEELSSIIAHELGHVALGHATSNGRFLNAKCVKNNIEFSIKSSYSSNRNIHC